jgi:hypothetical protein
VAFDAFLRNKGVERARSTQLAAVGSMTNNLAMGLAITSVLADRELAAAPGAAPAPAEVITIGPPTDGKPGDNAEIDTSEAEDAVKKAQDALRAARQSYRKSVEALIAERERQAAEVFEAADESVKAAQAAKEAAEKKLADAEAKLERARTHADDVKGHCETDDEPADTPSDIEAAVIEMSGNVSALRQTFNDFKGTSNVSLEQRLKEQRQAIEGFVTTKFGELDTRMDALETKFGG